MHDAGARVRMHAPDPAAVPEVIESLGDIVEVPRLASGPFEDARFEAEAMSLLEDAAAELAVDQHEPGVGAGVGGDGGGDRFVGERAAADLHGDGAGVGE